MGTGLLRLPFCELNLKVLDSFLGASLIVEFLRVILPTACGLAQTAWKPGCANPKFPRLQNQPSEHCFRPQSRAPDGFDRYTGSDLPPSWCTTYPHLESWHRVNPGHLGWCW